MGVTAFPGSAPDLSKIDFFSTDVVCGLVKLYQQEMFPGEDNAYIDDFFGAVRNMFEGNYEGFQAMDTAYHNIEHTMQATFCLVNLLYNRYLSKVDNQLDHEQFKQAVIAILLHDIGYLKEVGDNDGTGAKYTHVHEQRSCRHARSYLSKLDWSDTEITSVQNLINCTGPVTDINKIEFQDDMERLLGQAVCTADFIGQMSDPGYVKKLEVLFKEFVESYRYQQIPEDQWPFTSYEDLLQKTPGFWEFFVHKKMTEECDSLWEFFENPQTSENVYINSVLKNLAIVQDKIVAIKGN